MCVSACPDACVRAYVCVRGGGKACGHTPYKPATWKQLKRRMSTINRIYNLVLLVAMNSKPDKKCRVSYSFG